MENEDLKKLKEFSTGENIGEEERKKALKELLEIIEENKRIEENLQKTLSEDKE